MPDQHRNPSLYEMLYGNFSGGLDLHQVSEENQVILSVLDNMQNILNDIRHVVLFMENGGFCRVSLSIDKGCL